MSQSLFDLSLSRLSGVLFPGDLVAVVIVALAVDRLVSVLPASGPLRTAVGLPLLFFLPGYALVAALFPARAIGDADGAGPDAGWVPVRGVDGVERIVLSVGLSAVVLPVLGLALSLTPDGLSPPTVVTTITGFVVVAAVVASVRRALVPADERFEVPVRRGCATVLDGLVGVTRRETAVNVALAVSVTLTVVALGFAVAAPQSATHYTDLHLLTESSDGSLVAADYPTRLGGDAGPLIVGVENHEGTTRTYTVVVQLQRVADDGRVVERRELTRFRPTVAPGETWRTRYRPPPAMSGRHLRLAYLLYRGDPPATPTVDDAYREVHLWVRSTGTTNATATG
ncbi:MAG: DUF1616 domain-containing protein [Halorientalis sp.]